MPLYSSCNLINMSLFKVLQYIELLIRLMGEVLVLGVSSAIIDFLLILNPDSPHVS